jgi:hypothetical protein
MGPLNPTTTPKKPVGIFGRPQTMNVFQLRAKMGLPVVPPDPEHSSLMEVQAPSLAPRPAPMTPAAQPKPAANKRCSGHGSRANGTYFLHRPEDECYG